MPCATTVSCSSARPRTLAGTAGCSLPVDRKQRIYRSRIARALPRLAFPSDGSARRAGGPQPPRRVAVPEQSAGQWAHDVVLQRHAPPYLVVDEHFDVIEFSTGLAPLLDPAGGAASLNVFGLIHEQLRTDLRTALQKAKTSRAVATQAAVRVARNGHRRLIDLVVEPRLVDEREIGQFVVILKDHPIATEAGQPSRWRPGRKGGRSSGSRTSSGRPGNGWKSTVEQLETSNEELASSNEELLSMNEELQSSNEELEASQEELQSLNEELETINAQLAEKVEELDRAQDDLVNLLDATLFLDTELKIKRFTPGLTDVIALQPGDEGRFLGDFALKFEAPDPAGRGAQRGPRRRQRSRSRSPDATTATSSCCGSRPITGSLTRSRAPCLSFVDITLHQGGRAPAADLSAARRGRDRREPRRALRTRRAAWRRYLLQRSLGGDPGLPRGRAAGSGQVSRLVVRAHPSRGSRVARAGL